MEGVLRDLQEQMLRRVNAQITSQPRTMSAGATNHPFCAAIRDGDLTRPQFDRIFGPGYRYTAAPIGPQSRSPFYYAMSRKRINAARFLVEAGCSESTEISAPDGWNLECTLATCGFGKLADVMPFPRRTETIKSGTIGSLPIACSNNNIEGIVVWMCDMRPDCAYPVILSCAARYGGLQVIWWLVAS